MTKPLTFTEAQAQTVARGYTLVSYAGSSNAYGSVFRCTCGHEWSAKHNNVVSSNKTGCPACAAKAGRFSKADIETALAAVGRTLVSLDSPILGQKTKVTTRCQAGHIASSKLSTVIYAKKPCPDCSKARRGVDLDSFNLRLVDQGYTIIDWGGSTRKAGTFLCKCGGTWAARVNSVLHGQSHCPACFEGGFRGDQPAVFYIYELRHGKRLRYGYGISGRFDARDAEHRRNAAVAGWKISLCRLFEFERGVEALEIEHTIKATFPVPNDMFAGFKTEAIMPRYFSSVVATLTNSGMI